MLTKLISDNMPAFPQLHRVELSLVLEISMRLESDPKINSSSLPPLRFFELINKVIVPNPSVRISFLQLLQRMPWCRLHHPTVGFPSNSAFRLKLLEHLHILLHFDDHLVNSL